MWPKNGLVTHLLTETNNLRLQLKVPTIQYHRSSTQQQETKQHMDRQPSLDVASQSSNKRRNTSRGECTDELFNISDATTNTQGLFKMTAAAITI